MASQEELYIFLPSSVKSVTFENTLSKFQTSLTSPVTLTPGFNYEAALLKIIYPTTAENVYDGNFEYFSFQLAELSYARIPSAYYSIPTEFLKAFAAALGPDSEHYSLSVDFQRKRFLLTTKGDSKHAPYIRFSKNLQVLTGLPTAVHKATVVEGTTWDPSGGLTCIYCYSDLVRNSLIGNNAAPIVAVLKYNQAETGAVEYEPKNAVYLPLATNYLDNITVELRAKTGILFPFTTGETMLLFHIRMKRPAL